MTAMLNAEAAGTFWAPGDEPGRNGPRARSWLLTTADHRVAEALAAFHTHASWRVRTPGAHEVDLNCSRLEVLLHGDAPLKRRFVQRVGEDPVHTCDGRKRLAPMDGAGELCGCPTTLGARMAAARAATGPRPESRVVFKLAAAPELAIFEFVSTSWEFSEMLEASGMRDADVAIGRVLSLRQRQLRTRSGTEVSFVFPTLTIAAPSEGSECNLELAA
ncbi:hypothetical protein [Streptomyces sp. NPDC051684]|uniref:hypothetical protein n=1 Tax=Streptomyces sp. NPDC051684 TaxID=3365670 RepID=UPI0037B54522